MIKKTNWDIKNENKQNQYWNFKTLTLTPEYCSSIIIINNDIQDNLKANFKKI